MSEGSIAPVAAGTMAPRVGEFRRIRRVMFSRWVVQFGVAVIIVFALVAAVAPWIAPYGEDAQSLMTRLEQPSQGHWLGTDELGRDALSRMIYGSRVSLVVGIVAVSIAGICGMTMGLIAGYFGGWIGTIIMRITDALLSLPALILMLAIAGSLGQGLNSVLISIGIVMLPTYSRLMYAQVLTLKESDYVLAGHVIGAGDLRIMIAHLLPNAFPPLLVLLTTNLGNAILFEAALSFLGIGIKPPAASWGSMIATGYRYLMTNPLLSIAPGAGIMLVVLAFNMVGDGLRDALDPRLRGTV